MNYRAVTGMVTKPTQNAVKAKCYMVYKAKLVCKFKHAGSTNSQPPFSTSTSSWGNKKIIFTRCRTDSRSKYCTYTPIVKSILSKYHMFPFFLLICTLKTLSKYIDVSLLKNDFVEPSLMRVDVS